MTAHLSAAELAKLESLNSILGPLRFFAKLSSRNPAKTTTRSDDLPFATTNDLARFTGCKGVPDGLS